MSIERTFSPYRVCPLGAHVYYQFGVVSGFAIDKVIEIEYEKTGVSSVSLKNSVLKKSRLFRKQSTC